MKSTKEQKDDLKKEIEYIKKIESYLKAKEEIVDFIIRNKTFKHMLLYFSIFATIITLLIYFGGDAFIEYKIKDEINTKIAEKIDVAAQYLEQRNKITQLGDIAISKGSIPSYEKLEQIFQSSNDTKIKQAAEAEIKRVNLLQSIPFDYYPISKLEHKTNNGITLIGKKIPTPILVDMINQSKDIGKITTIIVVLSNRRHEKNLPQVLLNIGRDTDHLHIRYTALFRVQTLVEDFTANPYNYEEFSRWWHTSGKNKWRERK